MFVVVTQTVERILGKLCRRDFAYYRYRRFATECADRFRRNGEFRELAGRTAVKTPLGIGTVVIKRRFDATRRADLRENRST